MEHMPLSIGLDIGGTKIAGALFDDGGKTVAQQTVPTPSNYDAFMKLGELVRAVVKGNG